jgi:hypothetical protein
MRETRTDAVLLGYSVVVGLTPLIPLPFVDDAARGYLLRRMVRAIAEAHQHRLWDEEVRELADERAGNLMRGIFKSLALAPIKLILKKAILVLVGKRVVDLVSEVYHRGWLIDRAFANRWCAPHGTRSAREVRAAIEALLAETPVSTSPVTEALRVGFERSRDGLARAVIALRSRFGNQDVDGAVARGVENAAKDEGTSLGAVVAELRAALTTVPREHFEALERRLADKLGQPRVESLPAPVT